MKLLTQLSAIFVVIVSLGACAEFPDYKPAPGTSLVDVTLSPEMRKETLDMCESLHHCYELPPSNGVILVPTNQRISLYRTAFYLAGRSTKVCSAGISFEPKYGQQYFAAFATAENRCRLRIYRWGNTDLAIYETPDPTMGPPLPLSNH
jgi:hypothetical protein